MRFVKPPDVFPSQRKLVHIVRDPSLPLPFYVRLDGLAFVTLCGKNPTRRWLQVEGYEPCKATLCHMCRYADSDVARVTWDCTPWSSTCKLHEQNWTAA